MSSNLSFKIENVSILSGLARKAVKNNVFNSLFPFILTVYYFRLSVFASSL